MSEDPRSDEPSIAIELSRRKSARPSEQAPPGIPRGVTRPPSARGSIAIGRRAAAEYAGIPATMARIALSRMGRDRVARAGGWILVALAFVGVFADVLASDLPIACRWRGTVYWMPSVTRPGALAGVDCDEMRRELGPGDWLLPPLVARGPSIPSSRREALLPPLTKGHPLGTDAHGRDVFARVVHGARTALGVGAAASVALVAVGVTLGALAGFAGGVVDAMVARAVESLTAIPTLVLVLVVAGVVSHPTTTTLILTIALTRWTELARLVRAEVLGSIRSDYVTAARALGASAFRVLWRHVLPNAFAAAIVGASFALAGTVLIEATVDFLGVGLGPAKTAFGWGASWGELLGQVRANPGAWWLVVFPGAALLATLVALQLVGEAARDALDPRLRGGYTKD